MGKAATISSMNRGQDQVQIVRRATGEFDGNKWKTLRVFNKGAVESPFQQPSVMRRQVPGIKKVHIRPEEAPSSRLQAQVVRASTARRDSFPLALLQLGAQLAAIDLPKPPALAPIPTPTFSNAGGGSCAATSIGVMQAMQEECRTSGAMLTSRETKSQHAAMSQSTDSSGSVGKTNTGLVQTVSDSVAPSALSLSGTVSGLTEMTINALSSIYDSLPSVPNFLAILPGADGRPTSSTPTSTTNPWTEAQQGANVSAAATTSPTPLQTPEAFVWDRFRQLNYTGQRTPDGPHNEVMHPLLYLAPKETGSSITNVYRFLESLHNEYLQQSGIDVNALRDGGADSFWQFCASLFKRPLADRDIPLKWGLFERRPLMGDLTSYFDNGWANFDASLDNEARNCPYAPCILKRAFDKAVNSAAPLLKAQDGAQNIHVRAGSESYLDAVKGMRLAGDEKLTIQQYALLGKIWWETTQTSEDRQALDEGVIERALDYADCNGVPVDTRSPLDIENSVRKYLDHTQGNEQRHYQRINERIIAPLNAQREQLKLDKILDDLAANYGYGLDDLIDARVTFSVFERVPVADPYRDDAPRSPETWTARRIKDIFLSDLAIDSIGFDAKPDSAHARRNNGSISARLTVRDVEDEFHRRLTTYNHLVKSFSSQAVRELTKKALHSNHVSEQGSYYPAVIGGDPASRKAMVVHAKDEAGNDAYVAVTFNEGFPHDSFVIGSTLAQAEAYARQHPDEFDSGRQPLIQGGGTNSSGPAFHHHHISPDHSGFGEQIYKEMGSKARAQKRTELFQLKRSVGYAAWKELALSSVPGYQCVTSIKEIVDQHNGVTAVPDPSLPDDPSLYRAASGAGSLTANEVAAACVIDVGQLGASLASKGIASAMRYGHRKAAPYLTPRAIASYANQAARYVPQLKTIADKIVFGRSPTQTQPGRPQQPTSSANPSITGMRRAIAHGNVDPSTMRERLFQQGPKGAEIVAKVYPEGEKTKLLINQATAAQIFKNTGFNQLKFNAIDLDSRGHKIWDVPVSDGVVVKMLVHHGVLHKLEGPRGGEPKMTPATDAEKHAFAQGNNVIAGTTNTLVDAHGRSKEVMQVGRELYAIDVDANGKSVLHKSSADDAAVFRFCSGGGRTKRMDRAGGSSGACASAGASAGGGAEGGAIQTPSVDTDAVVDEYYANGKLDAALWKRAQALAAEIQKQNTAKQLGFDQDVDEVSAALDQMLRAQRAAADARKQQSDRFPELRREFDRLTAPFIEKLGLVGDKMNSRLREVTVIENAVKSVVDTVRSGQSADISKVMRLMVKEEADDIKKSSELRQGRASFEQHKWFYTDANNLPIGNKSPPYRLEIDVPSSMTRQIFESASDDPQGTQEPFRQKRGASHGNTNALEQEEAGAFGVQKHGLQEFSKLLKQCKWRIVNTKDGSVYHGNS